MRETLGFQAVFRRNCQARLAAAALLALTANAPAGTYGSKLPDEPANFSEQVVSLHNGARQKYGFAPLVWNEKLSAEARLWAEELLETNRFEHSQNRRNVGENLWMGTTYAYDVKEMMGAFLAEEAYFVPGVFPNVSRTGIPWKTVGHYTQIIWPETREVGCAIARGDEDDVLVCRYWPAGNVYGRRLP